MSEPFDPFADVPAPSAEIRKIRDDVPDWMDVVPDYEGEKAEDDEPLILIDPSAWSGIDPPVRRWKVKDYIPQGEATLLTGKGAAGKSLVSQLMCTCIALGLPFLGVQAEHANALYITCEDGDPELHRRQKSICDGLGVPLDSLSGKLFLLSLKGELNNHLATFTQDGRMSSAALYRRIVAICRQNKISFLILDNTAHLFTGNENDRHQVASFINLCNRLAVEIEGSVVIVGHPNKAGDSYSGSTAWENQVRSRLFMEIPTRDNGEMPDPDMRVIRREKVNYAQAGGDLMFMWHLGTFVLPGAIPVSGPDLGQTTADTRDNAIFLACLDIRNGQQRAVSEQKTSRSYAPKIFADMVESKGIGRDRLERAMDRLYRIDAVERGFLWIHKGEGKASHGLRRAVEKKSKTPPMTSGAKNTSDKKSVENQTDDLPHEVIGEVIGKSNDFKPMTSCADSDDLRKISEVIGKSNDFKPMTSPMTYPAEVIGKPNKIKPMTSENTSPPTGGMGKPSLGVGALPIPPLPGDDDEPPAWMDEAPPIEPPSRPEDPPELFGDWRDNPLLRGPNQ